MAASEIEDSVRYELDFNNAHMDNYIDWSGIDWNAFDMMIMESDYAVEMMGLESIIS